MKHLRFTMKIGESRRAIEVPREPSDLYAFQSGAAMLCNTIAVLVQRGEFIPEFVEHNGEKLISNGVEIEVSEIDE